MDIREEFEKLEEIAEILNRNGGGYYKERTNDYHHCNLYYDKHLNGAWYAFQEQQKKIDICKKLRDSQFNKLWNLTQAIERARIGADEDFDLFLNHLSNILKGEQK